MKFNVICGKTFCNPFFYISYHRTFTWWVPHGSLPRVLKILFLMVTGKTFNNDLFEEVKKKILLSFFFFWLYVTNVWLVFDIFYQTWILFLDDEKKTEISRYMNYISCSHITIFLCTIRDAGFFLWKFIMKNCHILRWVSNDEFVTFSLGMIPELSITENFSNTKRGSLKSAVLTCSVDYRVEGKKIKNSN